MAITPARTDLDRWVVLDKSVASFDEIPAEVQEEIKAELLKWMVSGEDTIAYSSESSYAANLEMATNAYKQSNRVVTEDQVARVETPGVKSIDEVAAFLNISEEQTIKKAATSSIDLTSGVATRVTSSSVTTRLLGLYRRPRTSCCPIGWQRPT